MPSISGLLVGAIFGAVESTRTKAQAQPFPADCRTNGSVDIVEFSCQDPSSTCFTYRLFSIEYPSNAANTIRIDARRHEPELNQANVTSFYIKRQSGYFNSAATEYTLFKPDERNANWSEIDGDATASISHPSGMQFASLSHVVMFLLNQLTHDENLKVLEVRCSDGSVKPSYWLGGDDWQQTEPKWTQRAPVGSNSLWRGWHGGVFGCRLKVRITRGKAMDALAKIIV